MRWFIASCLAIGCTPILALAQDSSLAEVSPPSLVHTARVYFDAYYQALRPVPSAIENMTYGNATYAPFTTDHWQVGVSPGWQLIERTDAAHNFSGTASLFVNYLFRDGTISRPYAGVFLEHGSDSYAVIGLQAGWLRFLTPSVAVRVEARYRHSNSVYDGDSYDLLVRFDPYLFGRANRSLTGLPAFGAVDLNFAADLTAQALLVNGLVAPFLTRWLQAGTDGFFHYDGGQQYQIEWFGRTYLPIDTRLVPFAEAFASEGTSSVSSHGARAGVRTYLTRGVAFDLAFEWRNYQQFRANGFSSAIPESRLLHASLTTQLGVPQ